MQEALEALAVHYGLSAAYATMSNAAAVAMRTVTIITRIAVGQILRSEGKRGTTLIAEFARLPLLRALA
jgi:hypothetical protein